MARLVACGVGQVKRAEIPALGRLVVKRYVVEARGADVIFPALPERVYSRAALLFEAERASFFLWSPVCLGGGIAAEASFTSCRSRACIWSSLRCRRGVLSVRLLLAAANRADAADHDPIRAERTVAKAAPEIAR